MQLPHPSGADRRPVPAQPAPSDRRHAVLCTVAEVRRAENPQVDHDGGHAPVPATPPLRRRRPACDAARRSRTTTADGGARRRPGGARPAGAEPRGAGRDRRRRRGEPLVAADGLGLAHRVRPGGGHRLRRPAASVGRRTSRRRSAPRGTARGGSRRRDGALRRDCGRPPGDLDRPRRRPGQLTRTGLRIGGGRRRRRRRRRDRSARRRRPRRLRRGVRRRLSALGSPRARRVSEPVADARAAGALRAAARRGRALSCDRRPAAPPVRPAGGRSPPS